MKYLKILSLALLLLVLLATSAFAQLGPREIVDQYCSLDFQGARIGGHPKLQTKINQLITWDVEPGWDAVVIVSAYTVDSPKITGPSAEVPVRYFIVGHTEGQSASQFAKDQEKVVFHLIVKGKTWVISKIENDAIKDGLLYPHISVRAFIVNRRAILKNEISSSRREILTHDIEKAYELSGQESSK